jgi:hypothetical protein
LGATTLLSYDELLDYVINADADALRVEMNGVSGTQYRNAGIVRYGSISERAAHSGYPRPISIWMSAAILADPVAAAKLVPQEGRRVYKRFCSLVAMLQPSYASITYEQEMGCPYDLRRAPDPYALGTFFVSSAYAGADRLTRLQALFADAYCEPVRGGVYISCDATFTPKRRRGVHQLYEARIEAAKLIAEAG